MRRATAVAVGAALVLPACTSSGETFHEHVISACEVTGRVDAAMQRWPGRARPPAGGDDAVAVHRWKRTVPLQRLWLFAYGSGSDALPDDFRVALQGWYDELGPEVTRPLDAKVWAPPVPAAVADVCARALEGTT